MIITMCDTFYNKLKLSFRSELFAFGSGDLVGYSVSVKLGVKLMISLSGLSTNCRVTGLMASALSLMVISAYRRSSPVQSPRPDSITAVYTHS